MIAGHNNEHTQRGWRPWHPFSERCNGGIETAYDWYYGCRYCGQYTPNWCEGFDLLEGHMCMAYVCAVCAVVPIACASDSEQYVCRVYCPTCVADPEETT